MVHEKVLLLVKLTLLDVFLQVVLENKVTLFIDDPLKVPGVEKNEDWVKFGYGYYVGAPWNVGQLRGIYNLYCAYYLESCKHCIV